jgi:hypothetical protein
MKEMTPKGLSMSLVSFGKLGAHYHTLNYDVKQSVEKMTMFYGPSLTPRQVSASIFGLGKGSWRWDQLSVSMQTNLLDAVNRTIRVSSESDISLTLTGLGAMGVRLMELPADVRRSVLWGASRVCRNGQSDEIAASIFGLGLMDAEWDKLSQRVRKVIMESILAITKTKTWQNLGQSGSVSALRSTAVNRDEFDSVASLTIDPSSSNGDKSYRYLDMSRDDIGEDPGSGALPGWQTRFKNRYLYKKQNVVHEVSPQSVANIMYALSLLTFDVEDLHTYTELIPVYVALLDTIRFIGIGRFNEKEREQVLIYTSLLETIDSMTSSDNSQSLFHDKDRQPMYVVPKAQKSSKLQQSVISSITTALQKRNDMLEVHNEYSSFGGAFPVDATIFDEGTHMFVYIVGLIDG